MTILKLVASIALGTAGWVVFDQAITNPDFPSVAMFLGVALQFVCFAKISPKLIKHLRELKGIDDEKEKNDDLSGGLKK